MLIHLDPTYNTLEGRGSPAKVYGENVGNVVGATSSEGFSYVI